jgi:autotransporter-associated beta strand protein
LDSNTGAFSFGSATIDLNGAGSTGALASQGALRNQNSGATTLANVVNMASDATIHTNNAGNSLQLNGNLTGTGLLTKTGGGTLIINGTANTHTGGYSVTNGVVTVNSGRTIGGPITMAQAAGNNTVFTINSNQTVSALASAWVDTTGTRTQTVNLNGAGTILTVDQTTNTTFGNGAVDTLASVIAGVGGLTKSNTGTLTLASANTYSGGTTISGGTVLATNSTGSATGTAGITVSGTGVLSGGTGAGTTIGSVTGATNVQTGGTIRADSGTGTNTLTVGNVTIQNGGTLAANIAATNNNSTLAVGGNVLDFATGSRLGLVGQSGFASVEGGPTLTYNLATLSSGSNIRLDGNVAGVADGFVFGEYVHGTGNVNSRPVFIDTTNFGLALNNGDRLVLNRTGNNLVLQFSPVPEPTTILGVAVGLVAVGGFIRKRLAKKAVVAA